MGKQWARNLVGFGAKAHQAVAACKQGAHTVMAAGSGMTFWPGPGAQFSRTGDFHRRIIIDKEHPTGIASIILDERGSNRIIVVPGANGAYTQRM